MEARERAVKDNTGLLDHKWISLNMRWDLFINKDLNKIHLVSTFCSVGEMVPLGGQVRAVLYVRSLPVLPLVGTLWGYPPPASSSLSYFFLAPSLPPRALFPSLSSSRLSRAVSQTLTSSLATLLSWPPPLCFPFAFIQLSCYLLLS